MSEKVDPRILFAGERTLLAWGRTSVSLMVFGFVIERFGLFLEIVRREEIQLFQRHFSFIIGESFVFLAIVISLYSVFQHIRWVRSLPSDQIPVGYNLAIGVIVNCVIGLLGFVLSAYLAKGFI